MKKKELTTYLSNAASRLIADVLKNTLQNPQETKFLLSFQKTAKDSAKRRAEWEEKGRHVPTFLISSITKSCNLFCKGCYARANGLCGENVDHDLLSPADWARVFSEAADLGVSFCLLAGGEPLTALSVLQEAAQENRMIYPVFTNGTLIDQSLIKLFSQNRHLVPVISMEGDETLTDNRRGKGVYNKIITHMKALKEQKILFGVSITVTTQNLMKVTDDTYLKNLYELGCRIIFFVEYVPMDKTTQFLALGDIERAVLAEQQSFLRQTCPGMVFLSFPGDEKSMGGCLAAGRGFFHINPHGGAEPCPFSPYSDCNVKNSTLLEVLDSPLFQYLQNSDAIDREHIGGCALFSQEDTVKTFLK